MRESPVSRTFYRIWAVVGNLWEGSRKQSFVLELILSGSRDNPMIGYLSQSFLEGVRNELVRRQQSFMLAGIGRYLVVFVF